MLLKHADWVATVITPTTVAVAGEGLAAAPAGFRGEFGGGAALVVFLPGVVRRA